MLKMKKIIIGQEAVCPDGLGRVVEYSDTPPEQWIKVQTYVNSRGCKWGASSVQIVPLPVRSPATYEDGN